MANDRVSIWTHTEGLQNTSRSRIRIYSTKNKSLPSPWQRNNAANWRWGTVPLLPSSQDTQKSWGQQGGHLSLVRAKLGSAGESHMLYIEVYAPGPGLCLFLVNLLGLPYQSATHKESQATQMCCLTVLRDGSLASEHHQQDRFPLTLVRSNHPRPFPWFLVVADSLILLSIEVCPLLPLSLQS